MFGDGCYNEPNFEDPCPIVYISYIWDGLGPRVLPNTQNLAPWTAILLNCNYLFAREIFAIIEFGEDILCFIPIKVSFREIYTSKLVHIQVPRQNLD